jgi:guanylate kinase
MVKEKKVKETKVFIFSGPGGVGKTTIVDKLFLKKFIKENFIKGISCTTRKIRPGEEDGRDYFFVSKEEFLSLEKKGFFLESEKVVNDYYGTPKTWLSTAKRQKKGLILCIDVKGGMYLKKNIKRGKIITLFISAPTEKDLYQRLGKRKENQGIIEKRIKLAKKELKFAKDYDYVIINQDLNKTVKKLEEILLEKKARK